MKKHRMIRYDGYCNLCSRTVQWIIRNDTKKNFTFRPLQDASKGETVMLILENRIFLRSSAVLRIAARLRFPWPLLAVFFIVPKFIRDPVYNLVARKRKKWFGERTTCYIPE